MMISDLTNDAEFMLCAMYKEYMDRRNMDAPKDDAILFGDAEYLQSTIFPMWPTHDITAAARDLMAAGALSALFGNNELLECALTKDAIVYMESRFQRNVGKLLDAISKLRTIIFPN